MRPFVSALAALIAVSTGYAAATSTESSKTTASSYH